MALWIRKSWAEQKTDFSTNTENLWQNSDRHCLWKLPTEKIVGVQISISPIILRKKISPKFYICGRKYFNSKKNFRRFSHSKKKSKKKGHCWCHYLLPRRHCRPTPKPRKKNKKTSPAQSSIMGNGINAMNLPKRLFHITRSILVFTYVLPYTK